MPSNTPAAFLLRQNQGKYKPTAKELRALSDRRIEIAKVHFAAGDHDAAWEQAGYAVEFALKARICRKLGWLTYPPEELPNESAKSFTTHVLGDLLVLGGKYGHIKKRHFAQWSILSRWTPECRYKPLGSISDLESERMIQAVESVLPRL